MRLRLLLVAAFSQAMSQAMSQLLSDAGGLSADTFDIALPKGQEVNWPASPLAGLDSASYLAAQPDSTPQRNQVQLLPDPVDSSRLAPVSDTYLITAAGCASPSPKMGPPPRTKRKLLRERQNVQNACPDPMPLTGSASGSATDNRYENPRLYPGGQKRRLPDWFFGTPQEWKQCPPEKKTLCCTGAQEGLEVRSCTPCTLLPQRGSFWR